MLNANVTSRIVDAATATTEALLLIDEPLQPSLGTNLIQGVRTAPNIISFPNVPFNLPGNGTRTFRITNVRVNASQTGGSPAGTSPSELLMYLSATGQQSVPLNNPRQRVGYVAPGLAFSVRTAADEASQGMTFQQAGGQNAALAASPSATGGTLGYLLRFSEGFASAFRKRNTATTSSNPTALAPQNTPGFAYGTETGYYDNALPATKGLNTAGLATQGTRLMARFTGVPAGVALYVTVNAIPGQAGSVSARLVATADGDYIPVTPTTSVNAGGSAVGIAPVALSGGAGSAVWEIVDANPEALDQVSFGVVAAYVAPQPGTATVRGDLAPLSSVGDSDASSPVPRFGESVSPEGCASSPCLSVPGAVTFTYETSGSVLQPVQIPVSSTGAPIAFTVSAVSSAWFDIAPAHSWLTVTPSSGLTPATLSVSVNPTGLAEGSYPGSITITAAGAGNSPRTIFVLLVVRVTGAGPVPVSCAANVAVPPIVRAEGLAELAGDEVLNCTGGVSGEVLTTDIKLVLNTPVTSRILNPATGATEALLLIDELQDTSGVPVLGTNAFQGRLTSTNTITFASVPLKSPGAGFRLLRISNLRVNANQVAVSPVIPRPSEVTALVSVGGVGVSGPLQTIAFAQPGLSFSLRTASGDVATEIKLDQAGGSNLPLLTSPNAGGGTVNYLLRFVGALKKRNVATSASDPAATGDQAIPAAIYGTETGFYSAAFGAAGLATQGTRLVARFGNIPPGVSLFVTVNQVAGAKPLARLIAADWFGSGGYAAVTPTTTANVGGVSIGIAPLQVSAGSASAVWEVLDASSSLDFGLVIAYAAPQSGSVPVTGLLAPLSTAAVADSGSPVPRFADGPPQNVSLCGLGQNCLAAPLAVSLTRQVGDTTLVPIPLSIASTGAPVAFTVRTWPDWLSANPTAAITPSSPIVTVNPAGLAAGVYIGTVTLSASDTVNGVVVIPVTLTMTSCTYALSSNSASFPSSGGSGSFTVTTQPGCRWNVTGYPFWINFSTGGGIGSGTVNFSVSANTGAARQVSFGVQGPVQGQTFLISQEAGSATLSGLRFMPVAPCRLVDTRLTGPALAGGSTRDIPVTSGVCGIPPEARAYSFNVTVVPPGPLGYLTIWPAGQSQPVVSTLNALDGAITANAAIVPAGAGGAISVFASADTHVIIDVNGYFAPYSATLGLPFFPVAPCRSVDTRSSSGNTGPFGAPAMGPSTSRDFPLPSGGCGLPGTARAYSVNATVVPPGPLGYLTLWPSGSTQPMVSTLNSLAGSIAANAALVPASPTGSISAYVSAATDLILDVNGYFGLPGSANGLSFYPVNPCRVVDTRPGAGTSGAFGTPAFEAGAARDFPIPQGACNIPQAASAYSVNVTVVPPGPLGYLTMWPTGLAQPVVSTLNSLGGKIVANAAIVPAGANGAIRVFTSAATDVIIDINGYFAP